LPIEKTPNFIRIRIANPKQFVRFFVKVIGKGIRAVMGVRKDGKSQIQSLLFPRSRFTLVQAKAWVKSHGYTIEESYWVEEVLIDSNTMELVFVEKVAKDDEEVPKINIKKMKKDVFKWLIE